MTVDERQRLVLTEKEQSVVDALLTCRTFDYPEVMQKAHAIIMRLLASPSEGNKPMKRTRDIDPDGLREDDGVYHSEENTKAATTADRDGRYLIWSNEHRMWWATMRMGYTPHLEDAGRYARDEAIGIAQRATFGWREGAPPNEIAIAEADAIASLTPPA